MGNIQLGFSSVSGTMQSELHSLIGFVFSIHENRLISQAWSPIELITVSGCRGRCCPVKVMFSVALMFKKPSGNLLDFAIRGRYDNNTHTFVFCLSPSDYFLRLFICMSHSREPAISHFTLFTFSKTPFLKYLRCIPHVNVSEIPSFNQPRQMAAHTESGYVTSFENLKGFDYLSIAWFILWWINQEGMRQNMYAVRMVLVSNC